MEEIIVESISFADVAVKFTLLAAFSLMNAVSNMLSMRAHTNISASGFYQAEKYTGRIIEVKP